MNTVLCENSLAKRRTLTTETAIQTSSNSDDKATQTGDGNQESSHLLQWVTPGSRSTQSLSANEQNNMTGLRQQQLNLHNQNSDPAMTTTESSSGLKSAPSNFASCSDPFCDHPDTSSQFAYVSQHGSGHKDNESSIIYSLPVTPKHYNSGAMLLPKVYPEVLYIASSFELMGVNNTFPRFTKYVSSSTWTFSRQTIS